VSGAPSHAEAEERRSLIVLLTVIFLMIAGFGLVIPLLPFFAKAFNAPAWQVTLMFSAFSFGQFLGEPFWGLLSDRIGRKPVFIAGTIGSAVMIFAYLWAISVGDYGLIFVFGILMFGVVYTATSAVWPSLYGEMFTAKVRLSGMAIGTQIGFAISGFVPSIATWTAGSGKGSWLGVAVITAILCLLSGVTAATARETYRTPTEDLGKPAQAAAPTVSVPT
jgi:MFS family permease